jgi:hypothetical protein
MVSDPSMRPTTHWARRPNSFAAVLYHVGKVSSSASRTLYYIMDHVVGLITTFTICMWLGYGGGLLLGAGLLMEVLFMNAMGRHMMDKVCAAWLAALRLALARVRYRGAGLPSSYSNCQRN